jgi:cob(II)yrinic acid a,c-diamide reductase
MDKSVARAMAALTTGIYVLTVAEGERRHGMSSSWVTQASGAPPLISAAVDNAHFTNTMIARTGAFGLNIVGRRGKALEDYFYSARARRPDNLDEFGYDLSPVLAMPWLRLAAAAIEARVVERTVAGDHTLFIAEVAGVRLGEADRPLTSLDLEYVYVGGTQLIARDRTGWS